MPIIQKEQKCPKVRQVKFPFLLFNSKTKYVCNKLSFSEEYMIHMKKNIFLKMCFTLNEYTT